MTLTDKDKLIRELRINPAGCEECEYADSKLNCTRGFQFASACESICEASQDAGRSDGSPYEVIR